MIAAKQILSSQTSEFLLACKDDVLKVKALFRERKYRRCAVLCSQALQDATHPLHRAFLHFYQAICYETLAHISHNYSSNKIPLLEQAKDSFISANDLLPLPFLTTANGQYDQSALSPNGTTEDLLDYYGDSPSNYSEDTPFQYTFTRGRSFMRDIPNTTHRKHAVNEDIHPSTPRSTVSNHRSRLSHSLSSQHVLAEELVPSPLYSRAPLSRKDIQGSVSATTTLVPIMTLGKPLPLTPINRPLPALPFNHHANFMLKGKRIIIVPTRKTALSTLIQRFEGRGPFDASPGQFSSQGTALIDPTPTTDRFRRISAVFGIKTEDNNEKMSVSGTPILARELDSHKQLPPVTPCPKPHQISQPKYRHTTPVSEALGSTHLDLYNSYLSNFRASLLTHISTVAESITKTHTTQADHEAEKRRNFAAMKAHSRNPSSIPAPSPTKSPSARSKSRARIARASQLQPVKDARLRSFWSLQVAVAQDRAEKNGSGLDWEAERKTRERKERIETLRKGGWKDVRKEAKGWKGQEYYEELRRSVEEELRLAGC